MTYEFALASVWPAVAKVARSELGRFGLEPDVVEDLVQDAATVVMRRQPEFASADDLAPYVRVVVRRLAYRRLQKQAREVVGSVPERFVLHSVPEVVEHRLQLRGTVTAFAALPSKQQSHLRDYLLSTERAGDARERARERKQIERIRLAMSRVAEGFAAALGWVRSRSRWLDLSTPQVAGVACALTGLVALMLPLGSEDGVTLEPTRAAALVDLATPPPSAGTNVTTSGAEPSESGGRTTVPAPKSVPRERPEQDVISIDTPTGRSAGVWTSENPDDVLLCSRLSVAGPVCVEYSDLPVPIDHNGLVL